MATPADSPPPADASGPGGDTPIADPDEAAAAAATPPDDPRRPSAIPGLEGDPLSLEALAERIVNGFGAVTTDISHGELTVQVAPERVHALLLFCRDDDAVRANVLADLSALHWPAGEFVVERQPATTGWPDYRIERDRGVIEVDYLLRSWFRNHHFRVSVGVDDTEPVLPSVTDVWPTANFHEREVHDMFGVDFTGHPNLRRILMPDEWVGHPGRKDYPLGGVEIEYEHDKFIPSPQDRELRQVVGGERGGDRHE